MLDGLHIERTDLDDATVVAVRGQVDVATAPELRQILTEVQFSGERDVIVDLDGVEFLDSFGLGVLLGAVRRARAHGRDFVVVCSRPRLLHLFSVARIDAIVRVIASLDER